MVKNPQEAIAEAGRANESPSSYLLPQFLHLEWNISIVFSVDWDILTYSNKILAKDFLVLHVTEEG